MRAIRGAILVKIKIKIIAENASFQGYFTEVCFDTSKETNCPIFKMVIFSKFFDAYMRHIIG